jgi:hypothetical protein
MKRITFPLTAALLGLLFSTGCKNGNLFGGMHKSGDSSKTEYLLSDAAVAMHDKDYSTALALYDRVLAQNPGNAEALSGAASAAIGSSGLNFGALVSNILSQSSSLAVSDLGDFVSQAREQVRSSATSPNSLLRGVDLESLNNVIDQAICRLNQIVLGNTDGTISRNDINTIVNLGALYIVRAVLKPLRAGYIDITNTNGSYGVVVDPSLSVGGVCASQSALVQGVIVDTANAYALFNRSSVILNLTSDKLLSKLSVNIQDVGSDLLAGVPPACQSEFTAAGISNLSDIQNWNRPFTTMPSGC